MGSATFFAVDQIFTSVPQAPAVLLTCPDHRSVPPRLDLDQSLRGAAKSVKWFILSIFIGFSDAGIGPMNLSLRQLRCVVAAADSGHVTGCGQAAECVATLDFQRHCGAGSRSRRAAFHPSPCPRGDVDPVGERVVNEARLLLKHAQDFTQNAIEFGDALKGEIAVGCFLTLAIRFMPGLLAGFAQTHPGITVRLQEGDQEEMISTMLAGRIELALAYSLAVPDEINAEPLIDLPPCAIVAANHPLARRQSVSLRELADDPFILLDLPYSRDYFFGLFRAVGLEPRVVFRSRSRELIRGLVAHGHGFAIQNAISATTYRL